MDADRVRDYFNSEAAICQYTEASQQLGLWASEEKIFTRIFQPSDSILELGCGAGRIAIGLYELGYKNVLATDYAKNMLNAGKHLARKLEYRIAFRLADAQSLEFEENIFDGIIFGFNGWTQIPGSNNRLRALHEVYRVLRPGAYFVFTTHDRDRSPHQKFWRQEAQRWAAGAQNADLLEFGDRLEPQSSGVHFMHVPTYRSVAQTLQEAGFQLEASIMRSEIGQESPAVLAYSDDCRFWLAQKPTG
jgi:ubiquinone/menaquinone biosynthesis C-methylase UbiE